MNLIDDKMDLSNYGADSDGAEEVVSAAEIIAGMRPLIGKSNTARKGHALPWSGFEDSFRLRPGEFTLWAGVNGHGKTQLTGMVALDLMAARQKVCIISLEMKPPETMERMCKQFSGQDTSVSWPVDPREVEIIDGLYSDLQALSADTLWLYKQTGSAKAETILKVARYCARKLGINHLFIDNLAKCVRGSDTYNDQKDFVDALFAVAKDYGMSIHLIHHIRKLENEAKIPDKMDVKGAGEIADIVDNICVVWRNKVEANKRKEIDHDAVLSVVKQRHGKGWEGKIGLFYNPDSQQYVRYRGEVINFMDRCA